MKQEPAESLETKYTRTWKTSTLKSRVATIFQEMIRAEAADSEGMVECVTCEKRGLWKGGGFHAGHFLAGRYYPAIFQETNVHPQCIRCNNFLHGNQAEYLRFMVEKYGQEEVDRLKAIGSSKLDRDDLLAKRREYLDRKNVAIRRING